MVKKTYGRKKIEMEKVTKNLPVTFSKRKSGLFKKANELSTLCGAEVALMVVSPGGNLFSFGHPNVDVLLNRFFENSNNPEPVESTTNSYLQSLNEKVNQVMVEKEKLQKIKNEYKITRDVNFNKNPEDWSQNPPEELNLTQAIQMKHVIEDFKKKIDDLLSQIQPNYYVGSSSNVAPSGTFHPNNYGGISGNVAPSSTFYDDGNNIYTNQDLNTMMDTNTYDPNMISTPNQTLTPFGYNHNGNNISERFVTDYAMNPMSGYNNHNQIQNQEFEQGYPHYGPPY